ncbi:MerR family transcriptional regulator [Algiphilus aromaticivorans]|uniref:MerR family transcriptional regulator n=1 Tax=Algiphilus aromaticivorans TaxID=382454 RepID=UPI0005C24233|nr:MerR family transcriptional regulator [Algiphilus aromaticivorans]
MRFSIGTAARRTGCPAATIRYYERVGLLPGAIRGSNGYRYYGDQELQRITFVTQARDLGFPIAAVRSLLALASHPDAPCDAVDEQVAEQLAAVRSRIARLQQLEVRLAQLQGACDRHQSMRDCGILAALSDEASS